MIILESVTSVIFIDPSYQVFHVKVKKEAAEGTTLSYATFKMDWIGGAKKGEVLSGSPCVCLAYKVDKGFWESVLDECAP